MRDVIRPFRTRRTWAELLFAVTAVPLGAAGIALALTTLYAGVLLAITVIGLPLVALALRGAGRLGGVHRWLARHLLGTRVAAPTAPRPEPGTGFLGWVWAGLRWTPGWRAGLFLIAQFPAALLGFVVAVVFWVYGASFVAYPVLRLTMPAELGDDGRFHNGIQLWEAGYLDTWPLIAAVVLAGILLLAAAPWATHWGLWPQRSLIRALLGPTAMSERVRDLETTRALAVDDAAAALRRVERDLHDGAQARLVAVAMKLGMARDELEELEGGDPEALGRTRALVDTAHASAKQAIAELRDLARGIHPPVLDNGLGDALASLGTRMLVPVTVTTDLPGRPSPSIETIAYFCAAELLTNVAKHSGARRATVTVTSPRDGRLRLEVGDDGVGGARITPGSGLAGLADRVRTVDGSLGIDSPAGGPTTVTVELPFHA
jgi:signal transduction histidine kinase